METTLIGLTFDEIESIISAMAIAKKTYELAWSKTDQEAMDQIRKAWYRAYVAKERKEYGKEESRTEKSKAK